MSKQAVERPTEEITKGFKCNGQWKKKVKNYCPLAIQERDLKRNEM